MEMTSPYSHGNVTNAAQVWAKPRIPLEPTTPAAAGRTPSGRTVTLGLFSRADRHATWLHRHTTTQRVQCVTFAMATLASVPTVLGYRPSRDDPDGQSKVIGAIFGTAVGPALLALTVPLYWRVSDALDLRSRLAAERTEVAGMSVSDRLRRHLDRANEERLTPAGVAKAIGFIHALQTENPGALSDDHVTAAMASLIGGAVSVVSTEAFGLLTDGIAERAASASCEPSRVLASLQSVQQRASQRLSALDYDAKSIASFRCEREYQLALAAVKTVESLTGELPAGARAEVNKGWDVLGANDTSIADVFAFSRAVVRLACPGSRPLPEEHTLRVGLQHLVAQLPRAVPSAPVTPPPAPRAELTAAGGVRRAMANRAEATPAPTHSSASVALDPGLSGPNREPSQGSDPSDGV